MGRKRNSIPSLLRHPDGGWRVRINSTEYRVGTKNTPIEEVHREYAKLIERAAANPAMGRKLRSGISLDVLCEQFMESDESPTGKSHREKYAMLPELFLDALGEMDAADYDGEKHREMKSWLINCGRYCRWSVNECLMRIRRLMKFAQSRKAITAESLMEIVGVPSAKRGQARESEKRTAASVADVEATIPHLPAILRPLVKIQLLTGGRAGELVSMRKGEIDTTVTPWEYRPAKHKGQWRDSERIICIGPQARAILEPILAEANPIDYLFPPFQSRKNRHYTRYSYQRAIKDAAVKAGVTPWTSHQLRHRCGTEVRKAFGYDHAQAVLGHAGKGVTDRYSWAETAGKLAKEAMEAMG